MSDLLSKMFSGRERRRHPRVRGGLALRVESVDATVMNWSPGGFRVAALDGVSPQAGALLSGDLELETVRGGFTARVVTVYPDGGFGACFDEIDTELFRALANWRP